MSSVSTRTLGGFPRETHRLGARGLIALVFDYGNTQFRKGRRFELVDPWNADIENCGNLGEIEFFDEMQFGDELQP